MASTQISLHIARAQSEHVHNSHSMCTATAEFTSQPLCHSSCDVLFVCFFFLFFFSYFPQTTGFSIEDNVHEMSNPVYLGKQKKYFSMSSAENLPSMLSVKD